MAIPLLLIVVGVIGRIDFELTNDEVSRLDFDSSVLGETIGDDIFGWIYGFEWWKLLYGVYSG